MIKVGCCGHPVSRQKYREDFRLVEVNRTFYKYPRLSTVARWREEAPEDFEYTVKAHQEISHGYRLALEQTREPFDRMKEICRILSAEILLIQTPASFRPDSLEAAGRFFQKVDRDGLTLVWETRGPLWEEAETRKKLETILKKSDIPHVTDPFRIMPVHASPVAYFRLHGLGERMYYYQYTNDELRQLAKFVRPFAAGDRRTYVLFNNISMFEDAKRFLRYIQSACFPPLAEAKGYEHLRVLLGRARFPASKRLLTDRLGWRLVQLEDCRQVRLGEILNDVPSKTFGSSEAVLREIEL